MTFGEGDSQILREALHNVSDMVSVVDAAGVVEYVNPYGLELFGYGADEIVGTSMADHLHPDDLLRALQSVSRALDPGKRLPVTPAFFRVRKADGSYLRMEANAALGSGADGSAEAGVHVVLISRPTTDADLYSHLMDLLTTDAPSEKAFALVPQFGQWRQEELLHAVFYLDDDGEPRAAGSATLLELGGLLDPEAPWAPCIVDGAELLVGTGDMAQVARGRAEAQGVTHLRAIPVPDRLHDSYALTVRAHSRMAPGSIDSDILELASYDVDQMGPVLALVLAWRRQVVELRRAASTDPLTGLANRTGFWSGFGRRGGAAATDSIGVLCIDLDRFKAVNDSLGHPAGDALLVLVAERLRHVVRPEDLIARMGGDEFAVIVRSVEQDTVFGLAERIVDALAEPFEVDGHRVEIGASVGVATGPLPPAQADDLLDAADRALYQAKHGGRGRWCHEAIT